MQFCRGKLAVFHRVARLHKTAMDSEKSGSGNLISLAGRRGRGGGNGPPSASP